MKEVFAQVRFSSIFDDTSQAKLKPIWTSLAHLTNVRDSYGTSTILGSGSVEFLGELPQEILHRSATVIYAVELDFSRFRRQRDLGRKLQAIAGEVGSMGLDATVVRHEAFGGVTNASYIVASRGFDTRI